MRLSTPGWISGALELLLPDRCLGCARPRAALRASCGLCQPCFARLRRPFRPACRRCGRPLPGAAGIASPVCGACRSHPPPFDRLHTLWEYRPPLDRVLQALKFHRLDYLGEELAAAVAAGLGTELRGCSLVTPVPLHWRRRWLRGFNQAERIAAPLARHLAVPLVQPLTRAVATRAQARLPRRERLAGPRRSFRVADPDVIRGRSVLLVDDVTTTGATLRAAAEALRAAGTGPVSALAVALTPPPGPPPAGDRGGSRRDRPGRGNALHPLAR